MAVVHVGKFLLTVLRRMKKKMWLNSNVMVAAQVNVLIPAVYLELQEAS